MSWETGSDEKSLPKVRDRNAEVRKLARDSHKIARRVLPFLSEHEIPVNPANYRMWYEYFSDTSSRLRETLDNYLSEGTKFTQELTQALYQKFYSNEALESRALLIDRTEDKIQELALEIIKELVSSIVESSAFSQSIAGQIEAVGDACDLDNIRNIVADIIYETDQIIKSQGTFQNRIEKTSQELTSLQENLRRSEELANIDELTKLSNRRAFNLRLAEEMNRSKRYGHPLSLIMLDLDDFKKVNDNYGHVVGDSLLEITAGSIKAMVRQSDFPARYGGEEFVVICPETDIKEACLIAERIRTKIDETRFTVRGDSVKATISGGVSTISQDEKELDFIDRADKCLYLAKKSGKNRICTEEDLQRNGS
ncbi:MAG: GGDEF domain-containing protein [Thermodesulfobacteriota bacterium]|nr:GGDEF domain-containing protein [Thermodesulfobacteriota bacterium]